MAELTIHSISSHHPVVISPLKVALLPKYDACVFEPSVNSAPGGHRIQGCRWKICVWKIVCEVLPYSLTCVTLGAANRGS